MGKINISIEELGETLSKAYGEYIDEVKIKCSEALYNTGQEAVSLLNQTAPVSHNNVSLHLKDSFEVKGQLVDGRLQHIRVWSPKKYRLIHLVEFGHFHWMTGEFIQPKPFFLSTYEKVSEDLKRKISDIIGGI